MARSTNVREYQALAEFRFLIRHYLNNAEKAARSVGLEPQQYQSMLVLWSWWTAWKSESSSGGSGPARTAGACWCA
jgi:hypothetical protein